MKKIFLRAISSVREQIQARGGGGHGHHDLAAGFTAHDKRAVLEEMLNDDETLLYVYKSLCSK